MYCRVNYLVFAVLILSSICVDAQSNSECGKSSTCEFAMQQHPGTHLQITLMSGECFKAHLNAADTTQLEVVEDGPRPRRIRTIPYSDIQEIKKIHGVAARIKCIAGYAVTVPIRLAGGAVLAACGAVVGAVVGFVWGFLAPYNLRLSFNQKQAPKAAVAVHATHV